LIKSIERRGTPASGSLELDPAFCWQAVYSRDQRFDGRFFAGITTTGVYCRSICPASFGAPHNVRWFQSAAAAEAAGFRACKRCRPDTSPGSSAWFGTWAVVSHAVKLISQGALNQGNLEQLAERVGIGSRHLRRLFHRHLGASPLAIARSHRVQVARSLIVETDLPVRQIASCTGFASIRQFNHSVKTTFGDSPRSLRRLHRTSQPGDPRAGIVVHLPYRAPFDWPSLIRFLASRLTPGVEAVEGGCYRRTIEIAGVIGAIEVSDEPSESRLAMRVTLPSYDGLMEVVQRATRLFDLGADALHIGRHLGREATLAGMVAERPGLRVPGVWDGFELAVRAVLGQRLTVVDPPALVERLVQAFGEPVDVPAPGLSRLFPKAGILADANLADLGVPRQRAETIASLARAVLARKVTFDGYRGSQGIFAELRLVSNLDENVMSYIAMRSVGEPDVFPYADLGLRRALGAGRRVASAAEVLSSFEKFRPWRAYAAMHLWAATEQAERRIRTAPKFLREPSANRFAPATRSRISK
jgi:AraC family transcriptional regulator, regulatory protein of adaptative response / DNA-3-methyladenine glycosylase II